MEIIGRRESQVKINFVISKKLIVDIHNQVKTPSVTISADATNCCDRIAHPFSSLTAQHFVFNVDHVMVPLQAIQSMNIFSVGFFRNIIYFLIRHIKFTLSGLLSNKWYCSYFMVYDQCNACKTFSFERPSIASFHPYLPLCDQFS